jgi:hypothetical protein
MNSLSRLVSSGEPIYHFMEIFVHLLYFTLNIYNRINHLIIFISFIYFEITYEEVHGDECAGNSTVQQTETLDPLGCNLLSLRRPSWVFSGKLILLDG